MKNIRTFFNYLKTEKYINVGEFYKRLYVCKEEIPVICLLPEQLKFLITDRAFEESLSLSLRRIKAIFVFGCTVALRRSDLFSAKFTDIETRGANNYLQVRTQKTHSLVRIKLSSYAVSIVDQFRTKAGKRKTIFPPLSLNQFNKRIKVLALKEGWTQPLMKCRSRRGVEKEQVCPSSARSYRLCEQLSSHTIRRTAITTMLMLGMKEFVVKLISGHAFNSKFFGRYVNLAQSYLDNEMDAAFGDWVGISDQEVYRVTPHTV